MAIKSINPIPDEPKKGGGMFGSVLGGALGGLGALVAAPFTAGASLAAAPGLVSAGMGVGGAVGNVVDPAQAGSMTPPVPNTETKKTALQYMMKMPEVQLATMINSKNLLKTSDIPNADEYMSVLDQGIGKIKSRLGESSSIKFA